MKDNDNEFRREALQSTLETLFGRFFPLLDVARKDEIRNISRTKAEAFNRVRRYLGEKYDIEHFYCIIDKKKKFVKLFEQAEKIFLTLLNSRENDLVIIPRKTTVLEIPKLVIEEEIDSSREAHFQQMEINNMSAEDPKEHHNRIVNSKDFIKAFDLRASAEFKTRKNMFLRTRKSEKIMDFYDFCNNTKLTLKSNFADHFVDRVRNYLRLSSPTVLDMEHALGCLFNPTVYKKMVPNHWYNQIQKVAKYLDWEIYDSVKSLWLDLQIGAKAKQDITDLGNIRDRNMAEEEFLRVARTEKKTAIKYKIDKKQTKSNIQKNADIMKEFRNRSEEESNIFYKNRAEIKHRQSQWSDNKDLFIENLLHSYITNSRENHEDDLDKISLFSDSYAKNQFDKLHKKIGKQHGRIYAKQLKKFISIYQYLMGKHMSNKKVLSLIEEGGTDFGEDKVFAIMIKSQALEWGSLRIINQKFRTEERTRYYTIHREYLNLFLTKFRKYYHEVLEKSFESFKQAAAEKIYQDNFESANIEDIKVVEVKALVKVDDNKVKTRRKVFKQKRSEYQSVRHEKYTDEEFNKIIEENMTMIPSDASQVTSYDDPLVQQARYRFQQRRNFYRMTAGILTYKSYNVPTYVIDDLLFLGHVKGFIPKVKTLDISQKRLLNKPVRSFLTKSIQYDRVE